MKVRDEELFQNGHLCETVRRLRFKVRFKEQRNAYTKKDILCECIYKCGWKCVWVKIMNDLV